MMPINTRTVAACGGVLFISASALATFNGAMFNVGTEPGTWGNTTLVGHLDSQLAGFNYNPLSGFAAYFSNFELDRTQVITDVYRVNSSTTFTQGPSSITLDVDDLVFAYHVRLVNSFPGITVTAMTEAQVMGAPEFGFGQDAMIASLITGQGFVSTLHGRNPAGGNIDGDDIFGSSVDFEWGGQSAIYLQNSDFITLLMFTDPASLGQGVLNMAGPPGQPGGLSGEAQGFEAPPVLIPILPTPGTVLLGAFGAGALAFSRRRTR